MNQTPWRRRDWLGMAPALMLGPPSVWSQTPSVMPARLPGATVQDLHHAPSGHTWRVWVQRPSVPPPAAGYPVLWLLDGNAAFALAAQLARNGEARPEALRGDPLVVVAVGQPSDAVYSPAERQRDFTPPSPAAAPSLDRGGADHLLDFLLGDLRRAVFTDLPLDPQRQTLFGHSLGGLFVLHSLLTRPSGFTRYAAASPSIWWDGARLLNTLERFGPRLLSTPAPFKTLDLQLRVGALETPEAAATLARAAVQRDRQMIPNARKLAEQLLALHRPGLSVDFEVLPDLDHGAVMVRALIDALHFAQRTGP